MTPLVIDVRNAQDSRDVVHRAVQALAEGKLVAFPTETVYGLAASALDEQAVLRLLEVKRRQEGQALALAVKSADAAFDYVPRLEPLGRRMARRCWPGPVTLVLRDNCPDSLIRQLPPRVQQSIVPSGTIGLRVPAHKLILEVLKLMPGPLALSSANRSGEPDPVTAQDVVASLQGDVDLVLDDGRSRYAQPSSVVQIVDNQLRVLRAGVVSEATLQRLASLVVLFVCTGNTCRSPMAEMLCRKLLAERLKCRLEQLEDRGVIVMSAGVAAGASDAATPEAVQVMADRGLDLTAHITQSLNVHLVQHADLIFTMTQAHRQSIVSHWPQAAERTFLLGGDHVDIADPIGGPRELYRSCADQIEAAIRRMMPLFGLAD